MTWRDNLPIIPTHRVLDAVEAMKAHEIICPREGDRVPLSMWLDDETIREVFIVGLRKLYGLK